MKFFIKNISKRKNIWNCIFQCITISFGVYLNKIGCFCYEKQSLNPEETKEFVLTFFLDPKVVDDNKTKDISDVTLSFTMFSTEYYKKGKV